MRGMAKIGVHVFTPCDRTLSPSTTRVAQEIEIAAPHELQSGARQSNRAITQSCVFQADPHGTRRRSPKRTCALPR